MRAALLLLVLLGANAGEPAVDLAFFTSQVEPVLKEHCLSCHDAAAEAKKKLKGKLRMDTWAGLAKGGENRGPCVVPGEPAKSSLITSITTKDEDEQMPPPAKPRVPAASLAILERWVAGGAPHPDREPAAATPSTTSKPPAPPPPPSTSEQLVTDLGLKHPAIVHFPIGCLGLALLAELLAMIGFRKESISWDATVRLALVVGLAGAVGAIISGLILAGEAPTALIIRHRNLGYIGTAGIALSALVLWCSGRWPAWRWLFRIVLAGSVIVIFWAGHEGGESAWAGRG